MVDFRKEDDIVCTSREKLEKFIRELLRLTTLVNTRMGYDIPKMISRLIYLGEDPKYYFCHKDFKRHMCQYNYDNVFKNDFKNKTESFDCTSYSMWVDQMLNYAGINLVPVHGDVFEKISI